MRACQEQMMELKRRLARLLVEKSYREGDFVLASGRRSDYYFDCRVTALHAEGSWLIGSLFNDMLKGLDIKGVGGMTLGADPLVSATTVISPEQGRPLPWTAGAQRSQGHGTGQYVEGLGNFNAGDHVAMPECGHHGRFAAQRLPQGNRRGAEYRRRVHNPGQRRRWPRKAP